MAEVTKASVFQTAKNRFATREGQKSREALNTKIAQKQETETKENKRVKVGPAVATALAGAVLQQLRSRRTDDDEEEAESECTCRKITINVLYANINGMNPTPANMNKLALFREKIDLTKPDIIAINETKLSPNVSNAQILASLGLMGWQLFRQDRRAPHENAYSDPASVMHDKKGGGLLIATNPSTLLASRDNNEELSDYIMTLEINRISTDVVCSKCNGKDKTPLAFSLIYNRPLQSKEKKKEEYKEESEMVYARIARLPFAHLEDYEGFCIVGDFNLPGPNKVKMQRDMIYLTPRMSTVFPLLSKISTHVGGNALDWVCGIINNAELG